MDEVKEGYLVVFAGPNGSGKSTTIKKYLEINKLPYICPDIVVKDFLHIKDEKTRYIEAMNHAEDMRKYFMDNNVSFAFETVLSTPGKINFLKEAKEKDYSIMSVYVSTLDPKINVDRVKQRVLENGHNVPTDKIISRYHKSLGLLPELIKVSDSSIVVDNSGKTLLCEFVKKDGKHYIYNQDQPGIKDFLDKYIIAPLEKEGYTFNISRDKFTDFAALDIKESLKILDEHIKVSVKHKVEEIKARAGTYGNKTDKKLNREIDKGNR